MILLLNLILVALLPRGYYLSDSPDRRSALLHRSVLPWRHPDASIWGTDGTSGCWQLAPYLKWALQLGPERN
jgi:hypothetical protein